MSTMPRTAYLVLRLDENLHCVDTGFYSEPGSSLTTDPRKYINVTLLEATAPTFEEAVKKIKAELAYRAGLAPMTWGKVATKLVGLGTWT